MNKKDDSATRRVTFNGVPPLGAAAQCNDGVPPSGVAAASRTVATASRRRVAKRHLAVASTARSATHSLPPASEHRERSWRQARPLPRHPIGRHSIAMYYLLTQISPNLHFAY